jgi:peroxiredoxin
VGRSAVSSGPFFNLKELEQMSIKPRQPVPALEFDTIGAGRWRLFDQKPSQFSMIVFYRGLHCPVCRKYTSELNGMIGEFEERGVSTVITSTDSRERAEQAKAKWGLANLNIGYGVSIQKAREWGLYISSGRGTTSAGVEEPPLFAEPGLFLVKPDGTLYWASISTMPFARPHFGEIAAAIDFAVSKNYPARGEA